MQPQQTPSSSGMSEVSSLLHAFEKGRSELSHFASPALGDSMDFWQIFNVGNRGDCNSFHRFGHSSTVSPFSFDQPTHRQSMSITMSTIAHGCNWMKNDNSFGASSPHFDSFISGPVQQEFSRLSDQSASLHVSRSQDKETTQLLSEAIRDEQKNTTASINSYQASSAPAESMTIASASSKSKKKSVLRAAASSKSKKRRTKNGRPKRALTAYNLFFKDQREQILADRRPGIPDNSRKLNDKRSRDQNPTDRAGISFEDMGKMIALRWKKLDSSLRLSYETRAMAEKQRYDAELADYLMNARNEREAKLASLQASVSEETKERYFRKGKVATRYS